MTFQEAMRATSRELSTRATITAPGFSFTATNEHIMGFTVDEGGVIPLGTASSARCTLDLANANNEWRRGGSLLGNRSLIGATVAIEIGVYHDGAWDWQPVAAFIVDETKAREHDTRFILTGNDPLTRLDVKFNDTMRYTASTTLNDVLNHIKSKGVTIGGTLAANGSAIVRYAPEWGDEPTIRQALCYVAQLGGSFVRCARNGNIELAPTNGATVHQINTSSYIDLTDEERVFLFNRIKLMPEGAKKDAVYVQSAVTSTPETAANTLVIKDNPIFKTRSTTSYYKVTGPFDQNKRYYELSAGKYSLVPFENRQEESLYRYYYASTNYNTSILQGIADGLKTALNGLNLRAASFRWRGDPSIRIGDKVTVTDTRGVSFTTTVLRQTFRFDQGFSAEISCPVELEGIAPFIMPSPHFGEGSIPGYALAQGSIQAEHVAAGTISATEIAAKTITADEIATKTITADEIKAGTITADEVAAKTITADEIAAGTITATEIGASQITATHIGTNEIVANAANIKDGVITNAKIANGTIENAKIKDATIETAKIKDAAITTAKIADAQVTNAKIANATIETAKIKDAAITTAKIQDAQITNAKIAAAGIDFANIKDVNAGTAIFRTGAGDDLYLDRLVVNSANIGTATIGELMVRDAQGKLHKVLIGTNGVVSSEEVQMDGQNLSNDAMMQVSQRLVWRQATQPSAPFIGMIWMDTSLTPAGKPKEILRRCTAITPSVVWEVVQSNELHTNVIDVDDNGMNVLSGGDLNLLAGGNLNIKNLSNTANIINMDSTGLTLSSMGNLNLTAGANLNVQNNGNLNVLNGGDIEVNNGGDINVAAGGKINLTTSDDLMIGAQNIKAFAETIDLSANNSIKLEVGNIQVGGTNMVTYSNYLMDMTKWRDWGDQATFTQVHDVVQLTRPVGSTTPIAISSREYIRFVTGVEYMLSFNYAPYYTDSVPINWVKIYSNSELIGLPWGNIVDLGLSTDKFSPTGYIRRKALLFTVPRNIDDGNIIIGCNPPDPATHAEGFRISKIKIEQGNKVTPWSPAPSDPASGVKTSSVEVNSNGIFMDTTGTFNVNAGVGVNIKGGSGASSIGISNNDANNYFLWAGHGTPASAPFSVKRDGSVRATKIQHEMPYTFWDMADENAPAEFPIYIPAGYTIDSVTFTFQTKKARTFAKGASSGGGSTSGTNSGYNTGTSNQYTAKPTGSVFADHTHLASHSHWMDGHSHTTPAHTHGINYGINEKATLATSCALKVGATTIGTYSPNPSNPVELKAHMSAGWNTVIVEPNDDARIVAFALVKLTPA